MNHLFSLLPHLNDGKNVFSTIDGSIPDSILSKSDLTEYTRTLYTAIDGVVGFSLPFQIPLEQKMTIRFVMNPYSHQMVPIPNPAFQEIPYSPGNFSSHYEGCFKRELDLVTQSLLTHHLCDEVVDHSFVPGTPSQLY